MESTESGWAGGPDPDAPVEVLHVDDDGAFLDVAADLLERESDRLVVRTETDPEAALETVAAGSVDCVVSDYRMPGMDGLELLAAVRDVHPNLPFVLFTGRGSEEIAGEAISAGITDYLQKGGGTDQYAVLANRVLNAVEQYRMENAVVETEERYRALLEHSRDVIVVLDETGTFEYVSPGITHTTGHDPEALVGDDAFEYIHPEDRQAAWDVFEAEIDGEGGPPGRVEYRFRGVDDEWHWFESIGSGGYEPAVGGYVISSREITDRKERERELEQYKTMMQTVPDGVLLMDGEGTMIRVNDAWAAMVGYDHAGQLEGEPFPKLVREGIVDESIIDDYVDIVRDLFAAEDDRPEAEFTTKVIPPDDAREHVYEVNFALLPYDEEFDGTAGVIRDVTEKVRRRRELERQNERLEKFASVVSHDLRNPLDIAMSQAELIGQEHGVDRADDLVETLEGMADLIDDVLALARQGRVVDDPDAVDLSEVVDAAAENVGLGETDATLVVEDDLPTVEGDRERLRSLFENLLTNAVEHGGPGVAIRVGRVTGNATANGEAGPRARTGFYVADDGPGIPPGERDQVFEAGYTTADDGTGFGLNIVEEIVEAHDWSVSVAASDLDDPRAQRSDGGAARDDDRAGGARFEVTDVPVVEEENGDDETAG